MLVIGGGDWGSALTFHISKNYNHNIDLFCRRGVSKQQEILKDITNITIIDKIENEKKYDYVLVAIPSQAIEDIIPLIQKNIFENSIIILCNKGIHIKSLKLTSYLLESYFPSNIIAFISGPNFASEILSNLPFTTTISSENKNCIKTIQELMHNELCITDTSDDVIGTQLYGAMKNIIAIACGISFGQKWGSNFTASLISKGLLEIRDLSIKLGGKPETLLKYCGIGDLFLTCNSVKSRNYKLGVTIGSSNDWNDYIDATTVEGYHTAKSIQIISDNISIDLPICHSIYNILYKGYKSDTLLKSVIPFKSKITI